MAIRNLLLSYLIVFCRYSWFWLGIWVFYYLRFTDYAGIGLVETVMITTVTLAEIPTGAIADLLGKRNTLIISFALEAIGSVLVATAGSFPMLCFAIFVMCIGGALYSGTLEALIYDTLKENKLEDRYDKEISRISAIALIAPAICGLFGGFLYTLDPRFPFLGNATLYTIALVLSFFLVEPHVDTQKFSFSNFLHQTKQGLHELVKSADIKQQTVSLLLVGFVVVIMSEMVNSFLGIEFGFGAEQQGILWAAIFILSAFATQLTPLFRTKFKEHAIFVVGALIALTMITSPLLGLVLGGISLTLRTSFESIFNNLSSVTINATTESKNRATTLSTFNMVKNLPYVLTAFFVGFLADKFSARYVTAFLGGALVLFLFYQLSVIKKQRV
ncbi:MAG: MFS transporter [Patescibacteria group bacterium]|jgi:MFS family permease